MVGRSERWNMRTWDGAGAARIDLRTLVAREAIAPRFA